MLSPRALHFTGTQIFWDCPTLSACESLPEGLPRELDRGASVDRSWRAQLQQPLPGSSAPDGEIETTAGSMIASRREIPYDFWKSAVRNYTSCELTFHKDKLKALWGIAQLVQESRGDRFVAGLWWQDLVLQLGWTVVDPTASGRPKPDEENWFPSWSWASLTDRVEVVDRELQNIIYMATGHDGQEVVTAAAVEKIARGIPDLAKDEAIIKLQSYRAIGFLARNLDGAGWVVKICDTDQSFVIISAFPDILPSQNNGLLGDCEIVVLAVGEKSLALQKDGTMIYGPGNKRRVYSGVGLLIKKVEHVEYSECFERIGVIKFWDMTRKDWEKLCRACGQADGTLLNEHKGKLFLV